jgi:hypothetical protein
LGNAGGRLSSSTSDDEDEDEDEDEVAVKGALGNSTRSGVEAGYFLKLLKLGEGTGCTSEDMLTILVEVMEALFGMTLRGWGTGLFFLLLLVLLSSPDDGSLDKETFKRGLGMGSEICK